MEDNQHIPPPPPSGSGIDSSIKGSSRKRVRSRDDVQFENMLESLTSNTSPRNHHHPNRQDWSNFEFPSSTSNNITLSPIILQNKQDQRPEINEFILQMMKVMCKFLKQIFDYLCSVSQSNQEIYHWKTIMHTSFWFLHNYIEYMFVSDDMITLSLACIYLSGKVRKQEKIIFNCVLLCSFRRNISSLRQISCERLHRSLLTMFLVVIHYFQLILR